MNIHELSQKLNTVEKELEKEEESLDDIEKKLIQKVKKNEENIEYQRINRAYQKYISQYSKEYIEMSDYYYGPTLPYEIYCKEFRKDHQTYLDSSTDIEELYKLFIFYMMFDFYTKNVYHY